MLFNSFEFIALLSITFVLYYIPLLSRFQVLTLILSSLIFYAFSQPVLVLLLLLSVSINIVSSYFVVYGKFQYKKAFAVFGVASNLAILIFFKYSPLFARTFFNDIGSAGEFFLTLPLPIGISFFTFQGISLIVDVYRGKYASPELLVPKSFALHARHILFFKAFFPQLISGPIVKAHDFLPQIGEKSFAKIDWQAVFKCVVIGYFLKMVVADNLKDFTFWIANPYFKAYSSLSLLTMLFGYSCQIFADFAGYSLIAIGIAKLFGYNFPSNFNFPYIATSFKEFWKRWHISLSSFLMEYLYFPLGGNRKGKFRTYANLFIVMLLGGLWHGAAWSYAVWGAFHGLALAVERLLAEHLKVQTSRALNVAKGFIVFAFVTLAWLLFKMPEFSHVLGFMEALATNTTVDHNFNIIIYVMLYSSPVVLYHILYLLKDGFSFSTDFRKTDFALYGTMLFLIAVNSGSPGTFIYFQF
jgi:alginate O-acetyltransferase complex protein AlgI